MTPDESQPPYDTRDKSSDPQPPKTPRGNWALTPEALDKFLTRMSPDRDEASKEFVALKNKLVRFFDSRRIDTAEDEADVVIDRVVKKIDEGIQIDNVISYAYGVAHFRYLEVITKPEPSDINWDTVPAPTTEPDPDDSEQELRQRCLDACLAKLRAENRDLILAYHREEGHAKIDLRKQLAARLSIPLNALRIRVHRIRVALEKCALECVATNVGGEI